MPKTDEQHSTVITINPQNNRIPDEPKTYKLKIHENHQHKIFCILHVFCIPDTLQHMILPTCNLYPKREFLSSNFTDVLSSIFLLYAVDHQLTNFALWIHVNYSAGFQLFAIFVPFHLCLVISYLTAQGCFLRESSFHFPLDRLFVEESGFSLDLCTRSCKRCTITYTKEDSTQQTTVCIYWTTPCRCSSISWNCVAASQTGRAETYDVAVRKLK